MALIGVMPAVFADDSTKPAADATANKEKLDFYRRRLREHRLFVEGRGDNPCDLIEDPLTRWDNPITQNADGLMFLWTDRGRPVVLMNGHFNVTSRYWGRVFVSLTDRPIEMKHGDQLFWKPRLPGSPLKPLVDAKPPADKPAARLVQMRNIAKEFQVICNWGGKEKSDWQMRLLPAPLYRYQAPDEGIVDGALFGYIQSGPEAVLLAEARQTPTGLEWHYSASRCTTYRIRFVHHDKVVAEFPHLDEWVNTEQFYPVRVLVKDYPFGNPFEKSNTAKPAPKAEVRP